MKRHSIFCSIMLTLTLFLRTTISLIFHFFNYFNRERILISILSQEIMIVILSRIVQPYCVLSRLPLPLPRRLSASFPTPDSSLAGLRGEDGGGRRGKGGEDGSRDDTIAAGDECAPGGKVVGV